MRMTKMFYTETLMIKKILPSKFLYLQCTLMKLRNATWEHVFSYMSLVWYYFCYYFPLCCVILLDDGHANTGAIIGGSVGGGVIGIIFTIIIAVTGYCKFCDKGKFDVTEF